MRTLSILQLCKRVCPSTGSELSVSIQSLIARMLAYVLKFLCQTFHDPFLSPSPATTYS